MDHHTRFIALVALAVAGLIPLHEREFQDGKIRHIMNDAAINDKAERNKVWDAARDNKISTLPPAEVKPAEEVRDVMLHHRFFYHPKF